MPTIIVELGAMERREVAEAVCRLAEDFYRLGDRSILDLLRASGYLQQHEAITVEDLRAIFSANPDLMRPWLSVGNGGRYGHYLLPPGTSANQNDWVVGHNSGGKDEHFQDAPAALARFVKVKADDLRYMIDGGPPIKARR
jgi:hypothetical protein